jgi:7-carboxy-7-deazaguanine synthase
MLQVSEVFQNIQGEGAKSGRAMTFIRLAGRNLRCDYCDTKTAAFTHATGVVA